MRGAGKIWERRGRTGRGTTAGQPVHPHPRAKPQKTKCRPEYWSTSEVGGEKKWKRRRAGPSPPPHRDTLPSYARRRRGARRGGAGVGMLGRRERPPGRQRPGAERGVYGKKPFRPSNRPSPMDAPRMGTPTVRHRAAVTAAAAEPPPPPSGLAKAGGQGAAAAGDGGPRSRRHEAPTPKESDGRGKRNEPSSGDGGEDDPPPTTTRSFGRPRGGRGDRPRDARASDTVACEQACDGKARRDKPLCRGLTFNRSQRGSCSATYETPTQKQVVYEWFSARFHTNVRST